MLEERPETRDGYKIVYDDETRQVGLATGNRVFIGFYGTFIQTLDAMCPHYSFSNPSKSNRRVYISIPPSAVRGHCSRGRSQ